MDNPRCPSISRHRSLCWDWPERKQPLLKEAGDSLGCSDRVRYKIHPQLLESLRRGGSHTREPEGNTPLVTCKGNRNPHRVDWELHRLEWCSKNRHPSLVPDPYPKVAPQLPLRRVVPLKNFPKLLCWRSPAEDPSQGANQDFHLWRIPKNPQWWNL